MVSRKSQEGGHELHNNNSKQTFIAELLTESWNFPRKSRLSRSHAESSKEIHGPLLSTPLVVL
jgi:hypothetical protein